MRVKQINQLGFSLIELLVVITISLILLGVAVASFLTYSDKRSILTAADELKTHFVSLQNKAKVGDLGNCDELVGYRIQTSPNDGGVQVVNQEVCAVGTAGTSEVFVLPKGVTMNTNLDMTFGVLNSGVTFDDGGSSESIQLSNGDLTYIFTISREGQITEGAWQ